MNRNITKVVKDFCYTTSINGLNYVVGSKHKIIWILFFILTTSYCLYQCGSNVEIYLRYNVSTKTTEKYLSNMNFPAITFCPQYIQKKSKYGNQGGIELSMAFYYSQSLNDVNELVKQTRRSCVNHNKLTSEIRDRERLEFDAKVKNGSLWVTNEYFVNFQEYITKCFWNDNSFDCTDAFLNHISDAGQCFTFNPGLIRAQYTLVTRTGNGLNLTNYDESKYDSSTGRNFLRLFVNTNQSEYCGNDLTKRGAGYFFNVHEINRNPSFLINPSTFLSPGYDIKIVMMPIIYQRKTEHLGKCTNFVNLYLVPNASKYIEEQCYMQCTNEMILKQCMCYSPILGGYRSVILSHFAHLGPDINTCLGAGFTCMKQWIYETLGNVSVNTLCPYCKKPCQETTYEIHITYLRLTKRNLQLNFFNNMTTEEFLKNYIFVTFSMISTNVQLIDEHQSFTLQGLFIYIGGNIGLYLGMSFLSLFEILQFFLELCENFISNLCKQKKRKTRVNAIEIVDVNNRIVYRRRRGNSNFVQTMNRTSCTKL